MLNGISPHSQAAGFASRSTETLSYRSLDLDLKITDNQGRELRIAFDYEDLQYSRTYSAAGVLVGGDGPMSERARHASGQEFMAQAAVYERQDVSYTGMRLEVEGDVSLLEDAYGIAPTAQRIFDFVSGMAAQHANAGGDFGDAMDEIIRGVNEGIEQAEALLGGLADISRTTGDLVNQMLNQFQELGADQLPEMPSAAEMLAQLLAAEDDEPEA